jgi:ethanolamine ammonia-lyase large subunit
MAALREIYSLRPAPEFELWLEDCNLMKNGKLTEHAGNPAYLFKKFAAC